MTFMSEFLLTTSLHLEFPDGAPPEEFLFEDYICHWQCMQCHTCHKPVIGEPSFFMAEKHKLWCAHEDIVQLGYVYEFGAPKQ